MKCPHCLENFFHEWTTYSLSRDVDGYWKIETTECPNCKKFTIKLLRGDHGFRNIHSESMVYPKGISRAPLSSSIPKEFADEYVEACVVFPDSPKASAALSRRCLQNLLRKIANIKNGDLNSEIQQVLDLNQLPSYLAEDLDAVRNIGNFAAHPNKSIHTGEIISVEPNESEWILNVIEGLFDFYFVQPEIQKQKRLNLNNKLKDAGKPPMKTK